MISEVKQPANIIENKTEISNICLIKVLNTEQSFKIIFDLYPFKNIDRYFYNQNIEYQKNTLENYLMIEAELINSNDAFNNTPKYYEKYSLEELKNIFPNFNWFDLNEFEKAFFTELKNGRYYSLIIKNILIINMKIKNIFGNIYDIQLILRPYDINYKENEASIIIDNKNIEEEISIKKEKIKQKINKKIKKGLNINNEDENENKVNFLCKKRNEDNSSNNEENNLSTDKNENFNFNLENNNNYEKISFNQVFENFLIELDKKFANSPKSTKSRKKSSNKTDFDIDGLNKSLILYNKEEEILISNMISNDNNKTKKYRLLFRASRDGDSAKAFHNKCDAYNNLIILVETTQGIRFGGFTSAKFGGSAHLKYDNNAFLFSLDNKKVFRIISNQYAIYCYPNSGPCFSYSSLYLPNGFFNSMGKVGKKESPYNFSFDFELNNGRENFYVRELEIFQVKIEDN